MVRPGGSNLSKAKRIFVSGTPIKSIRRQCRPTSNRGSRYKISDPNDPWADKSGPDRGARPIETVSGAQRAIVLTPGDVAIVSVDRTQVIRKATKLLQDDLAWQRGLIVFRNERLADAVTELNRYGGRPLRVADEDAGKLQINGTFFTGRPEEFAGAAHEIFGIRVTQKNGVFVLSR